LDRHSVPASRLKLEITETAVAEDPTSTIAVLRELHAAGIQISLDDFGAGYTSLAYLTALPLTELKIDRSFVEAVTQHADTTAVVNALIELGHRLGLSVVAEGVETEDTSRELIALGCDYIQGFLYSRPLAAEQIQPWMAARQDHHELPTWS
jgi:EAL domain-containing protein (putative c-di-GMP-specific phosphodiesterase class I)